MRRIHLIATGGTIGCVPGEHGLVPGMNAEQLLEMTELDTEGIACLDLFSMDSSNIQPEEWQQIAAAIRDALVDKAEAVVLTHGTDTMAYTASMLSFLLQSIPIPVVLTGAQYPMLDPASDGRSNLRNAIIAAQSMEAGVYICFGNAVIRGCRAVKTRTMSLNAFESINAPYTGTVVDGRYYSLHPQQTRGAFRYYETIDPNVALIKLAPGTSPALLSGLANCGVRGAVVEAFGLGGVHNFRRDHAESLKKLIRDGIPVVLTSQCLYEPSVLGVYAVSSTLVEAGVISARDMTTEAAVTKLMWALGQDRDVEKIRALMQTDLCGEIGD